MISSTRLLCSCATAPLLRVPLRCVKPRFQEAGQHFCQERKPCGFDVRLVQEATLHPSGPLLHTYNSFFKQNIY